MLSPTLPINQAKFEVSPTGETQEKEMVVNGGMIGMITAQFDDPKAEFDLVIKDKAGNQQFTRKGIKNESKRWGERIDLPLTDNYYIIQLENVKGTKTVDIFID